MTSTLSAEDWSSLRFSELQQTLDQQSSKIAETQEEGAASRRALASQTKAFRKLDDGEKLQEVRSLLKNYQSEIDKLTSRAKFAEQCFMDVYKALALLPDPAPLLDAQQTELDKLRASAGSQMSDDDSRLARELERQTLRVSQLEKQLSATPRAAAAAAAAAQPPESSDPQRVDALEQDIVERKLQVSKLQAELKEQQAVAQRYQTEHQEAVKQLAAQRDYADLRDELTQLKSSTATPKVAEADVSMKREVKRLETQNTELLEERNTLKRELDQVRGLVSKLEDDLSAMQGSDSFSMISGWTAVPRGGSGGQSHGTGASVSGSIANTSNSMSSGHSAVSGIIMQQRDRYKPRMQELSEKVHRIESESVQTRKELQAAKRDNHKLYDRVRQLQAVAGAAASGSSGAPVATSFSSIVPPLYEPTVDQRLKELDLDRRCVDQPPYQVKLLELSARCLVDPKFRVGSAAYVAVLHALVLLGFIF